MLAPPLHIIVTKYIYGLGLIAEETGSDFKVYHFDYRGSTVALTDLSETVTDRFAYDTYGRLIEHTGNSDIIFLYNGRDGVVTNTNGLYYMRARYYNPAMRRFVNADIVAGSLYNFVILNRYAYANASPVMFVDLSGLLGIVALMLIGAGIGAAFGAISSVVSQKASGDEIDAREVLVDATWEVDGAISFSPLNAGNVLDDIDNRLNIPDIILTNNGIVRK